MSLPWQYVRSPTPTSGSSPSIQNSQYWIAPSGETPSLASGRELIGCRQEQWTSHAKRKGCVETSFFQRSLSEGHLVDMVPGRLSLSSFCHHPVLRFRICKKSSQELVPVGYILRISTTVRRSSVLRQFFKVKIRVTGSVLAQPTPDLSRRPPHNRSSPRRWLRLDFGSLTPTPLFATFVKLPSLRDNSHHRQRPSTFIPHNAAVFGESRCALQRRPLWIRSL